MAEEPPPKKAKVDETKEYKTNLAEMLDKDMEGKSLLELVEMPIHVLQGISERADDMMEVLGVKTIRDLAEWKFGLLAQALVTCAELEVDGKRPSDSTLNIDKALIKEHEAASFNEVLALPPSALQGISPKMDEVLASHNITTIEKLGNWKYMKWAMAISLLSSYEQELTKDEIKSQNLQKKLE